MKNRQKKGKKISKNREISSAMMKKRAIATAINQKRERNIQKLNIN
jgi:hypothetical protein